MRELPLPRPVRLGLRVRRDVHKRLRARLERARAFADRQPEWLGLLVDDVHRGALDDLKTNSSASGPVTVQRCANAIYMMKVPSTRTTRRPQNTTGAGDPNMDCFVLKGYRIWNWGLELQDLHDSPNSRQ